MEKKENNNSSKGNQAVNDARPSAKMSGKEKSGVNRNEPDDKKASLPKKLKEAGDLTKGVRQSVPQPGSFWNQLFGIIMILVLVTFAYSYLSDSKEQPEELSISQVVEQVKAGEVKGIIVRGSSLEISYNDEDKTEGEAKKENDAAITETLTNLGATTEDLSKITIDVKNETGFAYYAQIFAPFLFPVLLLGLLIWFFSRSMKGGGMQALSFGNSKARFIDPKDQNQKVTFKDVAGAKEAKQELEEIIDFLKNPKNFPKHTLSLIHI